MLTIKLWSSVAKIFALVTATIILHAAWRADRRARAQLVSDLALTRQAFAQANARQHDRDAQLSQTLAELAQEKRAVITPTQILRELPRQIPLPVPITLQSASAMPQHDEGAIKDATQSPANSRLPVNINDKTVRDTNQPFQSRFFARDTNQANVVRSAGLQAIVPEQDLKPLYDFALDCHACQAKLTVAQADLADEQAKSALLARDRDEAVRMARGGSALRRISRAAKWFVLGALAGAVAARTAR